MKFHMFSARVQLSRCHQLLVMKHMSDLTATTLEDFPMSCFISSYERKQLFLKHCPFTVRFLLIFLYNTRNMPIYLQVVLYGYETWSLTIRQDYRLRVFENRILMRIFGPRGMRMESGEISTMRNFIVLPFT